MTLRLRWIAATTLCAVAFSTAAVAQTDAGQPVIAARMAYNDAIARRDSVGMRAVLSPTFHMVLGRSSQNHGADQTMARMQASFAADSLYRCVRTPDQVDMHAAWGLAQESGHWRCRYAGVPAGAPEGYATGTYNAKWQRDTGGAWRLQAEIYTTLECVGQSTACARPEAVPASSGSLPEATGSSAAAVRAARQWYNAAMLRADTDGIIALYTPDFHAVFGRGTHIEGVDAARADWETDFRTTGPGACDRQTDSVTVNEAWGLAHERGHWTCRNATNGGLSTPSGVYFAKWERDVTARWRVQAEVYTTLQCVGSPAGCQPPEPVAAYAPRRRGRSTRVPPLIMPSPLHAAMASFVDLALHTRYTHSTVAAALDLEEQRHALRLGVDGERRALTGCHTAGTVTHDKNEARFRQPGDDHPALRGGDQAGVRDLTCAPRSGLCERCEVPRE